MRCQAECYACLENLARKNASLAGGSPAAETALAGGLAYLAENFSLRRIPASIAGEMQRIIRSETGCADPFAAVKKKEMSLARRLADEHVPCRDADLRELVAFAARGNSFDFFQESASLQEEFAAPLEFARDDTKALSGLLSRIKERGDGHIIYLADNAGECYFDLPLVERLQQSAPVYYTVKLGPVQNDLTRRDLEQSGIGEKFKRVSTTGTDTPGLDLALVSAKFERMMNSSALVLAKGMGYYETLPEFSLPVPVFLMLKAKCLPVARSMKVPLNSYAAYFLQGHKAA